MRLSDFNVSSSICAINPPIYHYDTSVFPDDTGWYLLYERNVSDSFRISKIFHAIGENAQSSVVLPLVQKKNKYGCKTQASMENYYSVDFRPLCSTVVARALIAPLIAEVFRTEAPDILQLRPLDRGAPETELVESALKQEGWLVYKSDCQVNWIHNFKGSYLDYIDSLPGRLKNTLKRKSKKLLALDGVELSVHDGQTDLDELLHSYRVIYDRSWKVPEPHDQFVPELISEMARRGHLRMGLIRVLERPIAAHFWIVKQQNAYIYKLAHDSEYDRYSPGSLLMAEMVKYVTEVDGVQRLDFMTGDDLYKRDWMSERRNKICLTAYNPNSVNGYLSHMFDRKIKPIVRRIAWWRSMDQLS